MATSITTTQTRFPQLAVRHYRNVTRVGVPGHARPFQDTWHRFVDTDDNQEIGPSFPTQAEAFAYLPVYAAENGYEAA